MSIWPLGIVRHGLLTEQEWSEPHVTRKEDSWHSPPAPALVQRDSTVRLYSCVLPSKVRSIGTVPQHPMSFGRPTDQKLLAGYIMGVRVTASWGATWIKPGNHQRAYFDLGVVVWLTVEGLGLTGEAARLPGQPPQSQCQATSAKRWPASDTVVLRPDSPGRDSASCSSCASCTHAPHLM